MSTRRSPSFHGLVLALLGLAGLAAGPAARAADVGVSIGFSQPGVYGRIDIGRYPQPVLVATQPVLIARPAYGAEPLYLWVPPQHRHDWRHHCRRYGACGAPVYFVEDGWYRQHVVVRRDRDDDRPDRDRGPGRGPGHGHGHGRGHHDR